MIVASFTYHPLVRIHLGLLSISPHGLGTAVGFLAGAWLMKPAAERRGINAAHLNALLTRALVGSVAGARIAYIANHLSEYSDRHLDVLAIWKGGISLLGGFAGAILVAYPYMRRYRFGFWSVMDAAAPGMALGVVIGRIGDLIIGDHLGKVTSFFLGYQCPPSGVETGSPCGAPGISDAFIHLPAGVVVHQPALYDFVSTLFLLGLLLWLRPRPRYEGQLFLVFTGWYGAMRVAEDFFRIDRHILGLTGSQWAGGIAALAALVWLAFVRHSPARHASEITLQSQGAIVSEVPEVLFVCVHNAGRSQMAAVLLDHHAQGRVHVRSAGSDPAERINPAVEQALAEIGLDISKEFPKPLTDEVVQAADVVITMGCGDACPLYPGKRHLDWELSDPAGKPLDEVRPIRDQIDRRVRELLEELVPAS